MITIIIISIILYIIGSLLAECKITKPEPSIIMLCVLIAIAITCVISSIFYEIGIGEYKLIKETKYERFTIAEDYCYITIHENKDDGSYSIKQLKKHFDQCSFIKDDTKKIEHVRWNFGKGINFVFLLPLWDRYIIHA